MAWYEAWYGSWTESCGVRKLDGSYKRKEIFEKAQRFANETGKTVTIRKEVGSPDGLHLDFYTVIPQ